MVGRVTARRFAGPSALFTVEVEGIPLEVSAPAGSLTVGDTVGLVPSRRAGGSAHLFPPPSAS
jgi:hypothetical protein